LLEKKENRKARKFKRLTREEMGSAHSGDTVRKTGSTYTADLDQSFTTMPDELSSALVSGKSLRIPSVNWDDEQALLESVEALLPGNKTQNLMSPGTRQKFSENLFYLSTRARIKTGDPELDKFNPSILTNLITCDNWLDQPGQFPILIPGLPLPEPRCKLLNR
jgi:hypothetical protein